MLPFYMLPCKKGSIVVSVHPLLKNARDIFKITINGGTK